MPDSPASVRHILGKMAELTARNHLFLFLRAARSLVTFVGAYSVQAFLISSYPAYVNASSQVALKMIALQGLFTSGFSILILSHPTSYKKFLHRTRHAYWLSIATRLVLLLSLALSAPLFQELSIRLGIKELLPPLLVLLLLGLFGGEGNAYAYASRRRTSYELSILILQLLSFMVMAGLFVYNRPPSPYAATYVLTGLLLPKYLVDLFYSAKAYPRFVLFKVPASSTVKAYAKAMSSSLLMGIAFLNWSLDIIIASALGAASSVNLLAVFTLIFSAPQLLISFIAPSIQLRWSDSRYSNYIKRDVMGAMCIIILMVVAIAFLYWQACGFAPVFFPVKPSSNASLFVVVALSSTLGCFSTVIGLLMNSKLMIGRQVLSIGLVVTPLNLILSFALFPLLGVTGIAFATVIAQLLAIAINLRSVIDKNSRQVRLS